MAAELRMSRDTSAEEREAYVDGIISRLGLAKVGAGGGVGLGCGQVRGAGCGKGTVW